MSNKKKILFLKIYLVIFVLKFLFTIIGVQYIADKFNYTYDETEMMFLLSMAVDSILLVVFMLLQYFIKLEPEIVKADKYALRFDTYEQLKTFLARRVIEVGYEHKKTMIIDGKTEVVLYAKKIRFDTLDCFTIVRSDELSNEIVEQVNELITMILSDNQKKRITVNVNMISLFCVNRITHTFQSLVNSYVEQGLKNGRFISGISFGGKKLYIAKQGDGFAPMKYKKLRKQFFEIMEMEDDIINN